MDDNSRIIPRYYKFALESFRLTVDLCECFRTLPLASKYVDYNFNFML